MNLRSAVLSPVAPFLLRPYARCRHRPRPRPRLRPFSTSSPSPSPSPKMTLTEAQIKAQSEAEIKRNPHPDFKKVEASRPGFDTSSGFRYSKTPAPQWRFGGGANALQTPEQAARQHVAIDPYEEGRPAAYNYKLLISGIVPRPIAFVSTRTRDGKTENLAPFSYFQMVGSDPPLFVVGFVGALADDSRARDSLRNLVESGECVINIIGEHFVEAANSTSINAPYGTSEWAVSGLTPVYDCVDVKCARVKEAVFSIEGKLESAREFESRQTPGKKTSVLAVIEGTRFWVREDALNKEKNLIDPAVLRPVSRLGGVTYGRVTEAFEILRPDWEKDLGGQEAYEKLEKQRFGIKEEATANGINGETQNGKAAAGASS